MFFEFNDYIKAPDHTNLPLFEQLEALTVHNSHRQIFIIENENNILNNYDRIRDLLNNKNLTVNVVAHCKDQAISHSKLEEKVEQIFFDLSSHDNFKFVLIASVPYHWNIDFSKHKNFLYVYYPEYCGIYWDLYKDVQPLTTRKLAKHFLCLNKRAEFLRLLLYYEFYNKNWLDKSYFSYLGEDHIGGKMFCEKTYDHFKKEIMKFDRYQHLKIPEESFVKIEEDNLLQQYKNGFDGIRNIDPTWKVEKSLYQKSFCSIIIETAPTKNIVNVSEKTFRCISIQHPAIVFSSINTNKFLSDLGLNYNLYDEVFAHWDNDFRDFERFDSYIEFIEKIANTNIHELNILNGLVQEKLVAARENYKNLAATMHLKQDQLFKKIQDFVLN
jgi:hypothetical protein